MRTPGNGSSMVQAPPTRCAALDNQHALAGARQISRAGQAVVAGADDDGIPGFGRQFANGNRQPDFAKHSAVGELISALP